MIEFRKVPYALLIKKRNHRNSLKRRDLLAHNSTCFICTNLGRIRSLNLMQMNLVHSVPINLFWENSLDFFRLEVRKDTLDKDKEFPFSYQFYLNTHQSQILKRKLSFSKCFQIQMDLVIYER